VIRASAVWRRGSFALSLAAIAWPALAEPVALTPQFAGQYQAGSGIDASFLKVSDSWQQSSVLWNEATQQYGSGVPASGFGWGTGLWGLADWHTANEAPTPGMIEGSWSGRVGSIAFGDADYIEAYGDSNWGKLNQQAPLFLTGGTFATQDNWTSQFSGYIRIAEAGVYNFSVLHDDGFFFRLSGADESMTIERDFLNARDRVGFNSDLLLGAGLYGFELGAYERIELGVVELSWARNGGDWSRVPTAHLVGYGDATSVPEPATWALTLTGLLALASMAARRRQRR
jgi:hypothetical protein